jgi:hypothetical protein
MNPFQQFRWRKQTYKMNTIIESELHAIEGGTVPWIVVLLAGAVVGAVANGWSDFKDGVSEAYACELAAN